MLEKFDSPKSMHSLREEIDNKTDAPNQHSGPSSATNVTIRPKRSTSAPPKDAKSAPSGIIRGFRALGENVQKENPLTKSGKGKLPKLDEEDLRWERFEAQRNGGTKKHRTDRAKRK